ncbi:hypothetical protein ACRS6B_14420 [Nocardia asteroides]
MRRLDVSPASISTAVGAREKRDLIRENAMDDRDRYCIMTKPWYRTTLNLARAAEERVKAARYGAELLGVTAHAGARLNEISRCLDYLGWRMVLFVERWLLS